MAAVNRRAKSANQLDWFTFDFLEELSALSGEIVEKQSVFVAEAISYVLSLYESPRKVILVGHSMGGFVARSIFLNSQYPLESVRTILTLNTPHRSLHARRTALQALV
jgi:glycosylphosphatidylinositol deacylase